MIDSTLRTLNEFPRRVRQALQRKPDRFLERLREQARLNVQAAEALQEYMARPTHRNAQIMRTLEKEADEVRRILVDELNRTFVTPFDREDIYALSRTIDDILDNIWSTVNEMEILDVEPNSYLARMAELMGTAAVEIELAMRRIPLHPGVSTTHAVRARAADNTMELLYAEALADLFHQPKNLDAVVLMLKLREIYRHLFHASERVADAANQIEDIVVKFF